MLNTSSWRVGIAALTAVLISITAQPAASSLFVSDNDPRLTPATVKIQNHFSYTTVLIEGYIHADTVSSFLENTHVLASEFGVVVFDSAGGDIYAAMKLGRAIRQKGFATQVGRLDEAKDQITMGICESACPIAYLGGKFRNLDSETGQLKVHRFYTAKQGSWADDSKSLFDAERDLATYLTDMGISEELLQLIKRTPSTKLQTISNDSAYYWNVTTKKEFNSWVSEPNKITGRSETATGDLEIQIRCESGDAFLKAAVKPWFPVAALLNYDTHSVAVDADDIEIESVAVRYEEESGQLIMEMPLDRDTIAQMSQAKRAGYAFSFSDSHGQYRRTLELPADDFGIFISSCYRDVTATQTHTATHL